MSEIDEDPEPALGEWLDFIDQEMAAHPEQVVPLSADLLSRARALVDGITVDPDEDLGGLTGGATKVT